MIRPLYERDTNEWVLSLLTIFIEVCVTNISELFVSVCVLSKLLNHKIQITQLPFDMIYIGGFFEGYN